MSSRWVRPERIPPVARSVSSRACAPAPVAGREPLPTHLQDRCSGQRHPTEQLAFLRRALVETACDSCLMVCSTLQGIAMSLLKAVQLERFRSRPVSNDSGADCPIARFNESEGYFAQPELEWYTRWSSKDQ